MTTVRLADYPSYPAILPLRAEDMMSIDELLASNPLPAPVEAGTITSQDRGITRLDPRLERSDAERDPHDLRIEDGLRWPANENLRNDLQGSYAGKPFEGSDRRWTHLAKATTETERLTSGSFELERTSIPAAGTESKSCTTRSPPSPCRVSSLTVECTVRSTDSRRKGRTPAKGAAYYSFPVHGQVVREGPAEVLMLSCSALLLHLQIPRC
jgi:hypothetical protein